MNVPLLRSTFATAGVDALTRRFYDRLLSVYPQLRPMFSETDFAEQRRNLAASLATVVAAPRNFVHRSHSDRCSATMPG